MIFTIALGIVLGGLALAFIPYIIVFIVGLFYAIGYAFAWVFNKLFK